MGFNPSVSEGAFKYVKGKLKKPISDEPIIIITYSTASKCLGSMIEYFFKIILQNKINECFLIIDDAQLLFQNTSLIETIRNFKNIGLLSATPEDICNFKVFSQYQYIRPKSTIVYNITLYIHSIEINNDMILD